MIFQLIFWLIRICDVVFQAGSEIAYSHYDLRIYFSNGLIEYSFGGRKISFYSSSDTRVNKDLGSMPPIEISSYFDKYQLHVYSSLYDAITGKSSSITTIDEALNTLQVLSTSLNHEHATISPFRWI